MEPGTGELAPAAPSANSSRSVFSSHGELAGLASPARSAEWYGGGGLKRAFDIVAGTVFLILTSPLFALIAVAIKLDSRGPVFFRQQRIGRGGMPFLIKKFRKMPVDLRRQGPLLTRRSDPRLTRVGRWLERTKLDELPQLINILSGQMSMIGPRPEVPDFVETSNPLWRVVLSVRPGLFGISQIQGRNESSLYPDDCEDLNEFYRLHILPEKLERDAAYVRRAGLLRDMELLFRGVMVAAFGTVTGPLVRAHGPGIVMLCSDLVAAGLSFLFSYYVRWRAQLPMPSPDAFALLLSLALLSRGIVFVMMGIYRRKPNTLTNSDLVRIISSVLYSSALLLILSSLLVEGGLARSVLIMDTLTLSTILVAKAYGIEEVIRMYRESIRYWPLARMASAVAVGVGLNVLALLAALVWVSPVEVSTAPVGPFLGLIIGFAAIRAYGICRYGLRPTARIQRAPLDIPRILRGSILGSLFVYIYDMAFYSQLVTLQVLAVELMLSTVLIMILNQICWFGIGPAARQRLRLPSGTPGSSTRVLLVGIGAETEFYLRYLERVPDLVLVGVVDGCSGVTRKHTINNVPVLGGVGDLEAYLQAHVVDHVIYFPTALAPAQEARVRRVGARHEVPVRPFPSLLDLTPAVANGRQVR